MPNQTVFAVKKKANFHFDLVLKWMKNFLRFCLVYKKLEGKKYVRDKYHFNTHTERTCYGALVVAFFSHIILFYALIVL